MPPNEVVAAISALFATAALFAYPVLGRNKTIALILTCLVLGGLGTKIVLGIR